jgi:hypothetical protein
VTLLIPQATHDRWQASGNKSQRVALLIGQWAEVQQPHTIIPADDVLISRYPKVNDCYGMPSLNNTGTLHRAIRHLQDIHAIYRNHDTGHYYVAAKEPADQDR